MDNLGEFIAECLQSLPDSLQHLRADIAAHFEKKIESDLRNKKVLMRDEFDVLTKIVNKLDKRITKLEENT